jgi:transcription-repair coupling factor (superfamily II helicase)
MRGLSGFVLVFSSSSILREFLIYQWQRIYKKTIILSEKGSLFPSENEIEGVRKRKFADLARVLYESDEFIMTVTPDSFFSSFPSRNEWEKRKIRLQKGELNLERFLVFLSETGYERVSIVRERGEFARRGFIIDIFPSQMDFPVRIEMDGDEISSLKRFNPVNQVVMDEIDAIEIFPAEIEGDSKFADEIPQGSSIIVQSAFILNDRIIDWIVSKRYPTLLLSEKGVINEKILKSADEILEPEPFEFDPLSFLRSKANPLYALSLWTKDKIYRGMDVFFSYTTESGFKRLNDFLKNFGFEPFVKGGAQNFPKIYLVSSRFTSGFFDEKLKIALFPFESKIPVSEREIREDEGLEIFEEGDIVVHRDYGLGIYRGVVKREVNGKEEELLEIEYRNGKKLFLPKSSSYLLKKYRSGGDSFRKISLDTIDGRTWRRKKERVIKSINELSEVLLEKFKKRLSMRREPYKIDEEWLKVLSETFEYEETPHQIRTMEEIVEDLKREYPMERVVCGDAGYGKTEIAIRTACISAMNGRQVAVLAPTTVLAEQHYNSFVKRLKGFPLNIALLTRWTQDAQKKEIKDGLISGEIDIVIGTHSLLQRGISFKNIGLLIVDEEHKFGVIHKDIRRNFPDGIDILFLSATPIPRTLQLTLTGLRDLSRIETPPQGRLPVRTFIMEFDEEILKRVIEEEIKRKGQVFFVHTSIDELPEIVSKIKTLIPSLRVEIIHGRMDGKRIERVMKKFLEREIDLLVATIILGVGIDVPTANTIIVNNAHLFGLADLYHLRGRAGRSDLQGYAYFFVPKSPLPADAIKRLKAFSEAVEKGRGYYLAMKDLEIRGSGNILGREQWGHIYEIGFDTYMEILKDVLKDLKSKISEGIKF